MGLALQVEDNYIEYKPLELGCFTYCIAVRDIQASLDFYRRLGFTLEGGQPEQGWATLNNAGTELSLIQGLPGNCLNFRGMDIQALAAEHQSRGLLLIGLVDYDPSTYPPAWHTDAQGNALPAAGSGSYTVIDPDGNHILFDTVPAERQAYARGQHYCNAKVTGELLPGQRRLGHLEACLNVASNMLSTDFYVKLGLDFIGDEAGPGWTMLGSDKPAPYRVGIYKDHIDSNLLNFRGADIFALAVDLAAAGFSFDRGPEVEEDESSGLWLTDPDGNVLYFNTHPDELEWSSLPSGCSSSS